MAAWLVIPKTAAGPLRFDMALVVEAESEEDAAAAMYRNCVVVAARVFVSDATHRS